MNTVCLTVSQLGYPKHCIIALEKILSAQVSFFIIYGMVCPLGESFETNV